MAEKYYLDTSIWLDFFEDRNEPNIPKGKWAHELLNKITKNDAKLIYSDHNIFELGLIGYSPYELKEMFKPLKPILIFVESTEKEIGKASDLALKMSEFSIQSLTGGRKPTFSYVENSEHAQKPPDAMERSNMPPICDGWFLTEEFQKEMLFMP